MKGHRWNRWTVQEDEQMVQLRNQQQSYADIAKSLGKTGASVYRRLRHLTATGQADAAAIPIGSATPPTIASCDVSEACSSHDDSSC
jgi:hypothetical protein